ncbi:hypothetical protein AVEN_160949-1 [Araneus ventricosus]|uniref:Uncharacterized protein n=1 Tax=Araneus ventricosus TaxID=182803 RepID=A0A4Y2UI56_ARAVE|nr:hypothetical protein AVEN_160949-1 [Araneus ventricosus]
MHQASRHSGSSSKSDLELETRRLAVEILPLGHGGLDDFSKQHFRIILQSGGTFRAYRRRKRSKRHLPPRGGSGILDRSFMLTFLRFQNVQMEKYKSLPRMKRKT